jgi:hypothetical protein
MTDHITLPRAVGKRLRKLLQELDPNWWSDAQNAILDVLDAALAEPEQKPEPDVLRRWANANDDAPETEFQRGYDAARRWVREVALPALAEPEKERAETGIPARGVGVGSGETDPSRGEAYPTPQPDAKREPATREQVAEAYKASESDGGEVIYCEAWRDAERFHGIRKEDK